MENLHFLLLAGVDIILCNTSLRRIYEIVNN